MQRQIAFVANFQCLAMTEAAAALLLYSLLVNRQENDICHRSRGGEIRCGSVPMNHWHRVPVRELY